MPERFEVMPNRQGAGDREIFTGEQVGTELAEVNAHPMDSEHARNTLRKCLEWMYFEKDRQSANRLEMAMDADFYDNIQWDPEDAQVLADRGQMPLVFNEIAPMVDWIIGTERRTRVDWRVMPRSEDDVELADIKTKVMKYVSDINRVPFNRSRAFADAVKVGVGWVDDGVRDDPTQDVLYQRYEDWRNVLWDSSAYELDLSDARYLFRWRWVDEDIACTMFPDRAEVIKSAVEDAQHYTASDWEEDTWYTAEELLSGAKTGTLRSAGSGPMVDAKRRRVKLIECQYREPVKSKIISEGPLKGLFFNEQDGALANALAQAGGSIIDKVVMRVHIAVFTEAHMLAMGPERVPAQPFQPDAHLVLPPRARPHALRGDSPGARHPAGPEQAREQGAVAAEHQPGDCRRRSDGRLGHFARRGGPPGWFDRQEAWQRDHDSTRYRRRYRPDSDDDAGRAEHPEVCRCESGKPGAPNQCRVW